MSRKGNGWDNAPTASFWGRLKTASVYGQKFATREQARQAVMDWMAFNLETAVDRFASLAKPHEIKR